MALAHHTRCAILQSDGVLPVIRYTLLIAYSLSNQLSVKNNRLRDAAGYSLIGIKFFKGLQLIFEKLGRELTIRRLSDATFPFEHSLSFL